MGEYAMIDTHAHYDHPLFRGNGFDILAGLFEDNVIDGVVIPAITYESNFQRDKVCTKYRDKIYFAAGLHPKAATNEQWWDRTKQRKFLSVVDEKKTVAIKTGLDFSKKRLAESQKEHQAKFFEMLVGIANDMNLPLVFHIRDAAEEAIDLLKRNPLKVEAVCHFYTYDPQIAKKMLDVGITRFGIGGMITRDGMEPLRNCVKELPLSSILIETDAPFVSPKNYEGEVNTSRTLIGTAKILAELTESSLENIVHHVQRNAKGFYKLKSRSMDF